MQHQVDKDEEKHLILCRVLLGSVERVDLECYKTYPSNTGYDTGSDDPKNRKWYELLLVCVVSCKTSVVAADNCNISYLFFMNFYVFYIKHLFSNESSGEIYTQLVLRSGELHIQSFFEGIAYSIY